MMTALGCFYRRIPFGHVEAGLRTGNRYFPFPEEMNRVVTSYLSALHFAPTRQSRDNLLRERIEERTIHVTGNTVIDALLHTARNPVPPPVSLEPGERLVLVTAHRRENFGVPFGEICRAIRELADRHRGLRFLYPLHPNPNVRQVAWELLGAHPCIHLCEPLDYPEFVSAMRHSYLILTDSGGVQEEAPALAKPVLVLRDETERPEAVAAGVVELVGPHYAAILAGVERLLTDEHYYRSMARGASPYGDGRAAERIERALYRFFHEPLA
jgi:UDP-N-acetylglucosamine 2-epimerase (non-hydrolysing)